MLKDKQKVWYREGKIQFYLIPGHCGVEVNERADSEAKQTVNEGRYRQLLLPVADLKAQWRKEGKEELHKISQKTKTGQRRRLH
jgi:hypothetical protein